MRELEFSLHIQQVCLVIIFGPTGNKIGYKTDFATHHFIRGSSWVNYSRKVLLNIAVDCLFGNSYQ